METTQKLTASAPNREWYNTGAGWASRPWTTQGVQEAREGGAWFKGSEEFASAEARTLAIKE